MIVHLEITRELGYSELLGCNQMIDEYTIICKMLYRLIENWRSFPASGPSPTQQTTPDD
jgi:hypothetical protein